MPRLDPLPVVYYRRLGSRPGVVRSSGWGTVHRVRGRCLAYDFRVGQPLAPAAVRGDRWRLGPALDPPRAPGCARVYLPPETWVNAIARFDDAGTLLFARFDAATPPLWRDGACYQTDLFLDLLYDHGTGNYVVADESEFLDAVRQGVISARWAAEADAAISMLAGLGDRDRLPQTLDAWCPAPPARTEGLRARIGVEDVAWPEEAP